MGLIQSLLGTKDVNDVFIDFENAKPTNQELEIYDRVAATLGKQHQVMKALMDYKGCQDLARKAMSSPTPENEQAAFEGLLASVDSVSLFYHYAKELERIIPELLTTLAREGTDTKDSIADQQALAKQLADIFDFTLRFDALRMERPFLPNDFSYYRRLLPKFSKHPGVKIKDDEASGMALFTAEHIPMMTTLARACVWDAADQRSQRAMDALSLMANSCLKMIRTKRFEKQQTLLFCARAMTGSIVLYDHISPLGVFHKKSPVNIKQVVTTLKKDFPGNDGIILLNAIQFSTKHFKESSDSTKELFEDD